MSSYFMYIYIYIYQLKRFWLIFHDTSMVESGDNLCKFLQNFLQILIFHLILGELTKIGAATTFTSPPPHPPPDVE